MLHSDIATAVARADLGRATARKGGRNPHWPYVPVIDHGAYTTQLIGLAYATRAEAVARAERHLAAERAALAEKLADPRYRALREQHGLPTEITKEERS